MDQCLHLWRYTGGFEKIDTAHQVFKADSVRKQINHFVCVFIFLVNLSFI